MSIPVLTLKYGYFKREVKSEGEVLKGLRVAKKFDKRPFS